MIEMRKGIMLKFRCEFLSSMVAALAITVLFLNIVLPLVLLLSRFANLGKYDLLHLERLFLLFAAQDSSISVVTD